MGRSTSTEVALYLQHRVREAIKAGQTAAQLAKAAKVSGAQISELKNRGIGAGWQTAEGLARVFGMTMPQLMELAAEWARQQSPAVAGTDRAAEGKPELVARRLLAAQLAREDGVQEEAVVSVLHEEPDAKDAVRSTVWWILRMKHRELELIRDLENIENGLRAPIRRRRSGG